MDILPVNTAFPDPEILRLTAALLRSGEVIIHPSDTCYGFAGRWDLPEVRTCISAAKGRGAGKFYSIAVSDMAMAHEVVEISRAQEHVMKKHLPERLTCILPARDHSTYPEGIALRIPKSRFMRRLIQQVGSPLITTSANKSGTPSLYDSTPVKESFEHDQGIALLLDGGNIPEIAPSTIIDLRTTPPTVIREGSYPWNTPPHTPLRMCIGTRERHPQKQMLALSIQDGQLQITPGAMQHSGRQCYIQDHPDIIRQTFSGKRDPLKYHLGIPSPSDIIQRLLSCSNTSKQ